jgi:23S rRNA (cytidine1920-2'-O)/16S rRNA (cytidine1409-2'-O)-methyltransferase
VRRRLDAELVRRGLAGSRAAAARAIDAGLVTIAGRPATKPATLVAAGEAVSLSGPPARYVSRAGEKLAAALDRFGVDPAGRRALDAGASTGGFTQVLLERGAAHVVAVDVGYGQLDWSLRQDARVTVLERTNVRELAPERLPYAPDLLTADLSFISLRTALPSLVAVAGDSAELLLLVKPQFEAGRDAVGRGGVVRDPDAWADALAGVAGAAMAGAFEPRGVMASPLIGPAGNVEFLLHALRTPGATDVAPFDLDEAIAAAVREGGTLRSARA